MNNIFDDTILAEVLNFDGVFADIVEQKYHLINAKNYGQMSQLEKILYTLYVLRMKEQEILGESIAKIPYPKDPDGLDNFFAVLQNKAQTANKEDIALYNLLGEEAKFFFGLLGQMVRRRIHEITPDMSTYFVSGYQIVSGHDPLRTFSFVTTMGTDSLFTPSDDTVN